MTIQLLMPTTIRQSVTFKGVRPHAVYEALMDAKLHKKFTGGRAVISRKVGGKFTVYGDYIQGKNVDLIRDKKIVQTWRAKDWKPKDHYSQVTYALSSTKTGTRLTFTQTGVPAEQYKNIKQGWTHFYWRPMKLMLEK